MEIKVKKESTLLELLVQEFNTASKSSVKKIIAHGAVTLNGRPESNPATVVKPGDKVVYRKFTGRRDSSRAPYPVIFEDDFLLVVNKPAGILTHAEKGSAGSSLYKEMLDYLKERTKGKERIFVVHRLDREVSGIVLFAKSEEVQEKLKENWRHTTKRYWALVHNAPEQPEGTLKNWIKEGPEQKMIITKQDADAKVAVTHYKTVKKVGDYTHLEVELETGRKNQIRVQLSAIGCPVVGDRRYGAPEKVKRRIRLHAYYFSLKHPETGEFLEFMSRMPKGFLSPGDMDEKY